MITDVVSRILDFAVARPRNASDLVAVLQVLPRAATSLQLVPNALRRAVPGLDPQLAAKHNHAHLLPLYPRGLVMDQFAAVLEWIMVHNDLAMLEWCFAQLGESPAQSTQSVPLVTLPSLSGCWLDFPNWKPTGSGTVMSNRLQADKGMSPFSSVTSASKLGRICVLELWWQGFRPGVLNASTFRMEWEEATRNLLQYCHLELLDWLWHQGLPEWRSAPKRMVDVACRGGRLHSLEWAWALYLSVDEPTRNGSIALDQATAILSQGLEELLEWTELQLLKHKPAQIVPMARWSKHMQVSSQMTVGYAEWWWAKSAQYSWSLEWVNSLVHFAALFGRVDLLDWACYRASALVRKSTVDLVYNAALNGITPMLQWLLDHQHQLEPFVFPKLSREIAIRTA
ncbi:hypothetical protein BC828DRAFT_403485 [Blastocladiella britannica]|nr:hypothetical protein BC828DRAFT_403485 [Blastocladiella britannica]